MAFIERKNPIVLNIKLTSKGRELLSSGQLDFKYYALGDSEIDYEFNAAVHAVDSEYTAFDSTVLRAADKNANIISFIPRNLSGDPYNEMSSVPSTAYQVENQVESLGFFTDLGGTPTYITDSNHVKQPDLVAYMENVGGGDELTLYKASTYGTSGELPAIGDIILVKWAYTEHTTGFTVNTAEPRPHLFYKIIDVSDKPLRYYGESPTDNFSVTVDRELPNFDDILPIPSYFAGAMVYYNELTFSGDTILNMSPTDYLNESVINFLENSQCPTIVFPYWNLSIIYTEEIAGVQAGDLKYTQFKDRSLGRFVSYIQNQAPTIKKLGVIHYTNSSPANVYGEGFLNNTPTLDIPTIMWHKSPTATLGTTLSAMGSQQLLTGLNIYYYDLADSEGFVVGKIFPDLKIFVIEDQELLFAMSYKSNRSWTLPDYTAFGGVPQGSGEALASTVIWTTPTIQDPGLVCIQSQCYCYVSGSTSTGWVSFPTTGIGSTVCRTNVVNAGYKVCGFSLPINSSGSRLRICAYDYINSYCLAGKTCTVYGDPGPSCTSPAIITCANHTNNYCFGGVIDED